MWRQQQQGKQLARPDFVWFWWFALILMAATQAAGAGGMDG
jgi:hypothetical protein